MSTYEPTRDEALGREQTAAGDGSLFTVDVADRYKERWEIVQARFVDDPAGAVNDADRLTDEMLEELRADFDQHRVEGIGTDDGIHDDSTEALRQAFQRYRSFFERLLRG